MKSKGQFFIIFAVVFGLLLLGSFGKFNFAVSNSGIFEELRRTCYNYRHEVFMISNASLHESFDELQQIKIFTDFFIKEKKVEIFFVYWNTTTIFLQNNFTEPIEVKLDNNSVTINSNSSHSENMPVNTINITSPLNISIKVTRHKNFYSVLRFLKNDGEKEVYYC